MKNNELNPCPICQGKAIFGIYYRLRRPMRHYAVCTVCGTKSAIYRDPKTVKTQWNRRAKNETKIDDI